MPADTAPTGRIHSRLLLIETAASILLAQLALEIFSFQRLTWLFNRAPRTPQLSGAARRKAVHNVRWAVFYVHTYQLRGCTCLHRAIAAQDMLRRRGVGTTLFYGAATLPGKGLEAHAWVMDGEVGVVGHAVAEMQGYLTLARYPEA